MPTSAPKLLARTSALVGGTAALGSIATARGLKTSWYRRLRKPGFQPPPEVFPIAWTALYADIAVTSALAEAHLTATGEAQRARDFRAALATNLALNAGWSWVFFGAKQSLPGTVTAAALAASSADLARRAGQAKPVHGLLLAPYAAWCAFATVLTGAIWWRNRR